MLFKRLIYCFFIFSWCLPSFAASIDFQYDSSYQLSQITYGSGEIINYIYDNVGNRISLISTGTQLDPASITDSGLYTLDNTLLDLLVGLYGEEYGNLTYEFAIGTSPCGDFVVDWTALDVGSEGTIQWVNLNLPFEQQYFICVRVMNFRGDVVVDYVSSDGLYVLDPAGDFDLDGYNSLSEDQVGSNPLDPNSRPFSSTIALVPGFNLIAIPVDVRNSPDLRDWMDTIGDATEIEKVMAFDDALREFITMLPESTSNPSFLLEGGEGLIAYANLDKDISFATVLCVGYDLQTGFNLVGFACPPVDYTAFQLLTDIGEIYISSIQRYNTITGNFESAGFNENGTESGVNFPIVPGEGYILFMKQDIQDFIP